MMVDSASHRRRLLLRDNLTEEGLANPYRLYEDMRLAQADGEDVGRVALTFDDVTAVLSDRSMSAARIDAVCGSLDVNVRQDISMVEETIKLIVAFRDPPDHTRVRRLLNTSFTPKVLARQRDIVESAAERSLGVLAGRHEGDLFREVLFVYPAMVIASMLGVDDRDRPRFVRWALQLVFFVGSGRLDEPLARETLAAFIEMRAYFVQLIAQRREQPGDDLLSAMLAVSDATDQEGDQDAGKEQPSMLSEDEVIANCLFLMTAGHETAANQMSNGIITLLRHPEQLATLRGEPTLIDRANEEILRYEPAVQMSARIAGRNTVTNVAGHCLVPSDTMVVVLAAANRDPARYNDPDRFDITRPVQRHVSFAHGAHWCLGGHLARQEMGVMLPMILERFSNLAFASDRISWQPTLSFRGPTQLLVRWS
jgi:cytochrome P450